MPPTRATPEHRRAGAVSQAMAPSTETARLPTRRWHIHRGKAAALGLLCWVAAALVAALVASGHAAPLDALGLLFWRASPELVPAGPPLLVEMVRDLTALGGVLLRNVIALAAVAALLFLRLSREAALLVATVAGGWLVNTMIKLAMGRERPEIVPHLTAADGASFPSGHSFNSAAVFIAIALAFAALSARRSVRATIIAAALALSMAVA